MNHLLLTALFAGCVHGLQPSTVDASASPSVIDVVRPHGVSHSRLVRRDKDSTTDLIAIDSVAQLSASRHHAQTTDAITSQDCPPSNGPVATVAELHRQQCNIFPSGNLNAASFKWASFLLGRTGNHTKMTAKSFFELSTGYCPITGKPIRGRGSATVTLRNAANDGSTTGRMYYFDNPSICDMKQLVSVDSKKIVFSDTTINITFLVIGDPCGKSAKFNTSFMMPDSKLHTTLLKSAPEIHCSSTNRLQGAMLSDNGFPIIGVLYKEEQGQPPATHNGDSDEWNDTCDERAKEGFQTGKGYVFRRLAEVNPIYPLQDYDDDNA